MCNNTLHKKWLIFFFSRLLSKTPLSNKFHVLIFVIFCVKVLNRILAHGGGVGELKEIVKNSISFFSVKLPENFGEGSFLKFPGEGGKGKI